MSVLRLPPCPSSLRPIQHYLKTASDHENRDPVITYWCRLYSLQTALKIDKKSEEARSLLMILMDWLEKQKKALCDNESVTNDIAAQAYIENYALRLFASADSQDRAGVFNKNVVKSFYTSAMLMDILTTFGELPEEIAKNCKYAKWKAAYIHNCLKSGETPIPGPVDWQDGQNGEDSDIATSSGYSQPLGFNVANDAETVASEEESVTPSTVITPASPYRQPTNISAQPSPTNSNTSWTPYTGPQSTASENITNSSAMGNNLKLDPSLITKAQKYCKFASSALNYDDVSEAVNYLQKALKILQTGQDS